MAEWFKKTTIGNLVDDAARQFATREALYFNGRRWTFGQFQEDVTSPFFFFEPNKFSVPKVARGQ